ncbi:hypothetical protein [Paenibacillus glacialis]|uniref:DinB-like domain-containing protein n=1 Tax=Paenibacillus glacialis TaxID=494026 RepID=A0A168LQN3_9BACL|nr:hypothetical protein [Paenibacillus glacialis]OAB43717.1 hypothetical protein PGLA_08010 [Paenibacillus glacialis]
MDSLFDFKIISKHRMVNHYYLKFKASLESLNHNQIWLKESADSNSIGGIVIHIIEHVKRNTQRIINPDIKYEFGIEDLFADLNQEKELLLENLKQTFSEFEDAISKTESIDMYNIYHLVEHTGYHLGQVIDRTQRITGNRFQFVQNGINEKSLKEHIQRELKG